MPIYRQHRVGEFCAHTCTKASQRNQSAQRSTTSNNIKLAMVRTNRRGSDSPDLPRAHATTEWMTQKKAHLCRIGSARNCSQPLEVCFTPPLHHSTRNPNLTSLAPLEGDGEYTSSEPDAAEDAIENIPLWCELDADAGDTPTTNRPDEVADAGDTGGSESGFIGCCCALPLPPPPPPPPPPQPPNPSAPRYTPESAPPPGPATPATAAPDGITAGTSPL